MDANDATSGSTAAHASSPATARQGGTIEPSNLAALAKRVFEPTMTPAALRYEMHDPFAEVTYRTNSFDDMVAKANQLGSSRFVGRFQVPSATGLNQ